jgi:cell division protein FtsL
MNLRYVLFLTISAVAVVMICVYFLRLQATSTKLQKRTVSLQTTLKDLKIENDIEYSEIMSRVDLEDVRDRAISELGMDYPAQSQIVYYDAASSDYVKQYEEIPES